MSYHTTPIPCTPLHHTPPHHYHATRHLFHTPSQHQCHTTLHLFHTITPHTTTRLPCHTTPHQSTPVSCNTAPTYSTPLHIIIIPHCTYSTSQHRTTHTTAFIAHHTLLHSVEWHPPLTCTLAGVCRAISINFEVWKYDGNYDGDDELEQVNGG